MADEPNSVPTPSDRARQVAQAWREDWSILVAGVMDGTGLSRTDVLLFLVAMNMAATWQAVEASSRHPTFNPDCAHCMKEKARQELFDRYMERALKYMDDETKGDDWKPL